MSDAGKGNGELDRALDAMLARTLTPPEVPARFRTRLEAALARAADSNLVEVRSRLEREQREQLAELEQDYVRLRRRTLGTMIGAAFAAGAAAAVALPWLTANLGPAAPLAVASTGAVLGLAIGVSSWLRSRAVSDGPGV